MPILRPFRALRYDPSTAGPLDRLICPPYDVISEERQRDLAARDPHNAVHLELPPSQPPEDPDEPYRRAARALAAWRSSGVLRKDPRAAIYPFEQAYRSPDTGEARVQRGFLARLKLEELEPGGGVLRHERTLSGPKEDRYRLLRATGVNLSPVVGIHHARTATRPLLDRLTEGEPAASAVDDEGVRNRLWLAPADDPRDGATVGALLEAAAEGPITIADGHHRYETALRYRSERGRACESDPPFDYVLALLYDIGTERLTVLPTHRLVSGLPTGQRLWEALDPVLDVEPVPEAAGLVRAMTTSAGEPPAGGIGAWSGGQGALLRPRAGAIEALLDPTRSEASRSLEVTILAAVLDACFGVGPEEAAAGERVGYTKDATEAIREVDSGRVSAAFLLHPTPVEAVAAVAQAGEVMPQKSTFFYPKAPTGFLFNPFES